MNMWIVQKIKRESLVIQLPDSSLTELNNYNFYSMKEGFFMFGKKKKVKGNFISTCDARLIVEMLCAY